MAKLSSHKTGYRKRNGFSLIIVLIISIISLAMVGAAIQFTASSSGSGRVSSGWTSKYNILLDALEEGRALLIESMNNTSEPHRYFHKAGIIEGTTEITASSILLLTDAPSPAKYPGVNFPLGNAITRNLDKKGLERAGVFGESGLLSVRIYDMQYIPKLVPDEVGYAPGQITPEELELLPPSVWLPGTDSIPTLMNTWDPTKQDDGGDGGSANNAGVYLIRASLTINDADGNPIQTLSAETSVVQANNKFQ